MDRNTIASKQLLCRNCGAEVSQGEETRDLKVIELPFTFRFPYLVDGVGRRIGTAITDTHGERIAKYINAYPEIEELRKEVEREKADHKLTIEAFRTVIEPKMDALKAEVRRLTEQNAELAEQRDAYKEAANSALGLVTTSKFTYDEKKSMNGLVTKLGERISKLTEQNRLLMEDCQGEEEK